MTILPDHITMITTLKRGGKLRDRADNIALSIITSTPVHNDSQAPRPPG
jgi:hypothetical protein